MSEMSRAQGPVGGDVDPNPTDDMVPPGAQSPRDPDAPQDRSEYDGSEDVGPQDFGAEDVASENYGIEDAPPPPAGVPGAPRPAGVPGSRTGESGGEESSPLAQSSSDPMPDIAGQGESDL
jgi:hypothetical protein